ncbi:hypothetical protein RCL1_007984 [Eukaryota sp. TZLM3-RCL]
MFAALIFACFLFSSLAFQTNSLPPVPLQINQPWGFQLRLLHTIHSIHNNCPENAQTTLVTQLSFNRINRLVLQSERWGGPISAAIAVNSEQQFNDTISILSSQPFVCLDITIVPLDKKERLPLNSLRNLALELVKTPYILSTDVDLLPCPKGVGETLSGKKDVALILPAFEMNILGPVPNSKEGLVSAVQEKRVVPFKYKCKNCHGMTNYNKWFFSSSEYLVKHTSINAEPYFIIDRTQMPKYDERFCYGYRNRVSNVWHIAQSKVKFVVSPNVWLIHLPHEQPTFINRLAKGCPGVEKTDLIELWERFQREVMVYGISR